MNFKTSIVYCSLFCSTIILGQNDAVIISGIVTNNLQKPLVSATLIALPKQANMKATYVISDSNGYYKIKLVKGVSYNFSISHLGYTTIDKEVLFLENTANNTIT